jgi:LPXTG-motif cell wall-anchored protein
LLYRIAGALFSFFGVLQLFGYVSGGSQPRTGETGFTSGQYGAMLSGIALAVAGIYLLVKRRC